MRATSAALGRSVRGSHKASARARVVTTLQTGTSPVGTFIPILGGDVVASATSEVRTTLNITTDLKWPTSPDDLLAPYGNEIFVEYGVDLGNGQNEWTGLGYFRIDTPQQDEAPSGPITLSCPDRWQSIIDAGFPTPRQFAATITRRALVATLLGEVYPNIPVTWDDNAVADAAIGRALAVESDRAGTITDLVTALGKIGYFKYDGTYRIETPPSVTGAASWIVNAGAGGVMIKMARNLTRQGVYNIQVAESDSADAIYPVRYVAADYGPDSPTRVDGRFGPIPGPPFRSSMIITSAQAKTAAEQLLIKSLGVPYSVQLESVVHPGLEPYDVIDAQYPGTSRSSALEVERHVIDTVSIPLMFDSSQSIATRVQPTILIGPLP